MNCFLSKFKDLSRLNIAGDGAIYYTAFASSKDRRWHVTALGGFPRGLLILRFLLTSLEIKFEMGTIFDTILVYILQNDLYNICCQSKLRLDRYEFEQAPGLGDGQGSLACCSPWGRKE